MPGGFRTVGHSNRTLPEFVDILQRANVRIVADVRSFPRSRSNPVFNIDTLQHELSRCQIDYRHLPDLGGRRTKQAEVPESVNAFWNSRSFHNYADYALSQEFARAYSELSTLGKDDLVAIMCSEAVWWRCHRRLITDYLLLDGKDVLHLMGNGREDVAYPTPGAEWTPAGKVIYPIRAGDDVP